MEFVEPIKDKKIIYAIYNYLENKTSIYVNIKRDYVLFYVGINLGLRISDLLNLESKHFYKNKYIYIREGKTNKRRKIIIKEKLCKIVNDYIKLNNIDGYLFTNRYKDRMTRQCAYNIIKDIENYFGLKNLGTHTLKKTFGYHFYKDKNNLPLLQYIFNHAVPGETLKYIGISQDEMDEVLIDFEI